jgi:chaperonin GroEL
VRALNALERVNVPGEQSHGVAIIREAIQEPIKAIAANAGIDGTIVVHKVLEGSGSFGFDAQTETYGDMLEKGIIDPTKVTRTALQNAASVAGLLLTTEAVIAQKPEKKKAAAPGGGGGMGDMGGMGGMDF